MDEQSLSLELESPSEVTRVIKGEIAWEPVGEKLDEAYKEIGKSISLKGFRKGKVPRPLLAKMFHSRITAEISHNLVQEALVAAISRLDLRPVLPLANWEVEEGAIEEGQPLSFSATLEVLPEVKVDTWEGLEVKRREIAISEEAVGRYLRMKQEELTQFIPVEDAPMGTGHIIQCDVMGKVGDEAVSMDHLAFLMPSPDSDERPRLADPKQVAMATQLIKELRGKPASLGELDISLTFGDEAPEAWQGKSAQLLVELQAVRERRVPEIDDDLAKDSGEADSLEEYRTWIREQLMVAAEKEAKAELRRNLEKALVDANPMEVTNTLVERQLNSVMERARMAFQMRGVSMDSMGMDSDDLRGTFRTTAEQEVKKMLLMDSLARKLEVTVSEEELDARLTEIAEARGENLARVKAEYEKEGHQEALRVMMREEKLTDLLLTKARVTTVTESEMDDSEGEEPGDDKVETKADEGASGKGGKATHAGAQQEADGEADGEAPDGEAGEEETDGEAGKEEADGDKQALETAGDKER